MSELPTGWRNARLGDLAEDVTVGHVGSMAHEYRESGIPFIRSQNVLPHRFDLADVRYIDTTFHAKLKKSSLRPRDVVTVRTGKPGITAVVPDGWAEANCSDVVITRAGEHIDPYWLSYYINSAAAGFVSSRLVGAVQQHFNVGAAREMVLGLPPLSEQRAIAEVLGALDDKIAANRKLAEKADLLADATFDREASELPTVPLLDVLTPVLGATPSRSNPEFWADDVPWASVKDATRAQSGVILETDEGISELAQSVTKARPLPAHSVLLTARGTVGVVARVLEPTAFNQSCYGFEPGALPPATLYFAVLRATARIAEYAYGSVFDSITMSTFKNFVVPDFDCTTVELIEAQIGPLLTTVERAISESRSLSSLRDTLLPRLMSGELRVRDAERAVESVL